MNGEYALLRQRGQWGRGLRCQGCPAQNADGRDAGEIRASADRSTEISPYDRFRGPLFRAERDPIQRKGDQQIGQGPHHDQQPGHGILPPKKRRQV